MTTNDDSEKLAEAADELIKVIQAASSSPENSSMRALNPEALEALQQQWSIQTASVIESMNSLKESQDVSAKFMIECMANFNQRLENAENRCANEQAMREALELLQRCSFQTAFLKDSVALLKESQEANANATNHFTTNVSQRLANVEQRLANVEGHLKTLNESIAAQTKHHVFAWAANNAALNLFRYFKKPDSDKNVEHYLTSNSLVPGILLSFRQNKGYFIDNLSLYTYNGRSAETITKGETNFREALVNQIHALIGHEPRIAMSEGRWAIYYS